MPGTSAWLAAQTRAGGADAAREVRLATALDDDLPATAAALGSGALSPAHATVIAATTARLPASLSATDRVRVEAALVAKAKRLDPVRLRQAARRALEVVERDVAVVDAHEDALLREEETAALERTRLTLHDNHDGTVSGHFTVPTLAGAILRKAIQQLSSPRRRGAHTGPHADPDWARRQGEAFVEVLEHLPTDRLHGKVAATVVVTLDHDKLRAQVGAAGLDTGDRISAAEARRLACGAGILPAILAGASQVLDLGRTQRFFTEAQRTALATRHTTCAADGCDRPFAWCELHHDQPWSHGGRTDLKDAIPLCGHHHRQLHAPPGATRGSNRCLKTEPILTTVRGHA